MSVTVQGRGFSSERKNLAIDHHWPVEPDCSSRVFWMTLYLVLRYEIVLFIALSNHFHFLLLPVSLNTAALCLILFLTSSLIQGLSDDFLLVLFHSKQDRIILSNNRWNSVVILWLSGAKLVTLSQFSDLISWENLVLPFQGIHEFPTWKFVA